MRIVELRISRRALRKIIARGIGEAEPFEVWFNRHVILRNRRNRAASHRMVGKTDGGRMLTLLMTQTEDVGVWVAVNAWPASKAEKTMYGKGAR